MLVVDDTSADGRVNVRISDLNTDLNIADETNK